MHKYFKETKKKKNFHLLVFLVHLLVSILVRLWIIVIKILTDIDQPLPRPFQVVQSLFRSLMCDLMCGPVIYETLFYSDSRWPASPTAISGCSVSVQLTDELFCALSWMYETKLNDH